MPDPRREAEAFLGAARVHVGRRNGVPEELAEERGPGRPAGSGPERGGQSEHCGMLNL